MNNVYIECIGTALMYRKFNYMTPVLHDLHWLPLWQHIRFKLGMTIYKCLIVLAPVHMACDFVPVS